MTPVVVDGSTTEDAANAAVREPEIPVEEASRQKGQTRLERESLGIERRLEKNLTSLKAKMKAYQKEFPQDSTSQNDRQLQDAKDLIDLLAIVTDGHKSVEKLQNDIIDNVCSSLYLPESELENEITKAQDQLEKNQNTFTKFKQTNEFSKIRDRADEYIKFLGPDQSLVRSSQVPHQTSIRSLFLSPNPSSSLTFLGRNATS